jgi:hypothetical protein
MLELISIDDDELCETLLFISTFGGFFTDFIIVWISGLGFSIIISICFMRPMLLSRIGKIKLLTELD